MILFSLIAIVVVLTISLFVGLSLVVILQRVFLGGLVFALLGGIIGQLIDTSVTSSNNKEVKYAKAEIAANDDLKAKGSEEEDIEPLTFAKVNNGNNRVINEDPNKMAELIKNSINDEN
ncbi:hypothetical protein [Halonatronum saccharophilum]|uniref:hypothetical protein n=1 Tax=Halonatronum saccharophilum TaxID=150060 RepID=UPI001B7FC4D0|nr:hypothetical protein [Halonatronum saccharophilum]